MSKVIVLSIVAGLLVDSGLTDSLVADDDPRSSKPEKLSTQHLPNCVRIIPKVISGGLPEDASAFEELAEFGVKTVVSVDGAKPDVELAKKYGLRYVHLPHGYDGIPSRRVLELAKAVRDLEGPIYIHCHHGKHRSPAAASVACVSAGLITGRNAELVLELAGTGSIYRGLFDAVKTAGPIDPSKLDELEVKFPAVTEVPPLAEAMVALEQTHNRLMKIMAAGRKKAADQAEFDAPHQALLLREHFTEMIRMDEARNHEAAFRDYLHQSEKAARTIETALQQWTAGSSDQPPRPIADAAQLISDNCKACHVRYRDNR